MSPADDALHPHLNRQLKRAGISATTQTVTRAELDALIKTVNSTYEGADRDRRLNDRAWRLSSEEMKELHQKLERASASELAVERDRLSTVLNTTATGLCLIDADHRIIEINSAGAEFMQVPRAGAIGQNLLALLWPKGVRAAESAPVDLRVAISADTPWHGETVELKLGTAETKTCNLDYTPLRVNDSCTGGLLAFHDFTAQHRTSRAMAWAATHDPLTGLLNRSALTAYIDSSQALVSRRAIPRAVLFIDLDNFKMVNDTGGHDSGDTVLVEAASRINNAMRNDDVVARIGGDEFVVFLEEVPGADSASRIAERILSALRRPFSSGGQSMYLSASIGIAVSASPDDTANSLLRDADIALYRAKDAGRDQVVVFGEDLRETVQRRVDLDRKLRAAVANQDLSVAFQPMIDLSSGRVLGFETLARWATSEGFVGPNEFIPIAEENGLISTIGELVVKEAISLAAEIGAGAPNWPSGGGLVVAVNVSGIQLTRGGFSAMVARRLAAANVAPDAIALELTESSLVTHRDAAWHELSAARASGIHVALDDFGTGWSSLSVLQHFPIDCIKIDRSFVNGMTETTEDFAIVDAVIALGRTMGHAVVAEGVERQEQADALLEMGCTVAQGYLFGKPMSRAEAIDFLAESQNPHVPLITAQRIASVLPDEAPVQ
jgi:diguanylate cyclase (GGDEF)-like protein